MTSRRSRASESLHERVCRLSALTNSGIPNEVDVSRSATRIKFVAVNPNPERRRYPRIEILGRIKGVVRPLDVPITLLNLSLGGFLMQTPMEYRVGEIH